MILSTTPSLLILCAVDVRVAFLLSRQYPVQELHHVNRTNTLMVRVFVGQHSTDVQPTTLDLVATSTRID
jgi:hypothetical protein